MPLVSNGELSARLDGLPPYLLSGAMHVVRGLGQTIGGTVALDTGENSSPEGEACVDQSSSPTRQALAPQIGGGDRTEIQHE